MAYRGYHFFIGDLELPYAPSELKVTIGSKNETVELINGSEINILKNPKLTEVEFDIELPRGRQYAFANEYVAPEIYLDYFEKLMLNKKPTKLVITRPNPRLKNQGFSSSGTLSGRNIDDFFATELTVSLEGYKTEESAENAYDIKVSLKFKEYRTYGTVKKVVVNTTQSGSGGTTSGGTTAVTPTTKPVEDVKTHTVKSGDCLWDISRKYYGTGNKWKTIYEANKTVIEEAAKKRGRASSSNGNFIYPGTILTIPTTT